MDERLELHETLCEIVNITEPDGDRHTYFNSPASGKMRYPAIRYALKSIDARHANNGMYKIMRCYELTVIKKSSDLSDIDMKVLALPYCQFDRAYRADNLEHTVYTIYHK